jgi:hypothetical protein
VYGCTQQWVYKAKGEMTTMGMMNMGLEKGDSFLEVE